MDVRTSQRPLQRDRALAIHQRLDSHYAVPVIHQSDRLGPLSQLVNSLIAAHAPAERADRAFRSLCSAYWNWSEMRDAPVRSIHRALVDVDPSGRKAAIVTNALKEISDWSGWRRPSLDFLADYANDDAVEWLCRIGGVTPNIAAEALLLSTMRRAIVPVDSAHQRIAERTQLIRTGLRADAAQTDLNELLPEEWRPSNFEAHYFLFRGHARKYCLASRPKCGPCPIRELCPYGQGNDVSSAHGLHAVGEDDGFGDFAH